MGKLELMNLRNLPIISLLLPLLLTLSSVPAFASTDSVVVFNEIHYHPADETTETEWIELHSLMRVDVDVRGVELKRSLKQQVDQRRRADDIDQLAQFFRLLELRLKLYGEVAP